MLRQWCVTVGLVCLVVTEAATSSPADVQARVGRLIVAVSDQTGAVIQRASVVVSRQDDTTPPASPTSAETNGVGVALIDGLPDGRYSIHVDYPGFETAVVRDVRIRGGDTRRRIILQIHKLDEAVTVGRDRQTSSLDAGGSAFSTVLTREQIDSLPDDPEEMEAVLKAMSPPGSTIRVDGFTGGRLPPKSQIRSIRLPRMDMYAAQNHGGMMGMMHIDIMTMPGNGPLRANVSVGFLDEALNARNAFTPTKADEQSRQFGVGLSGTIVPNKTSFSINGNRGSQYVSPNLLAVLPDGTTVTDTIRQPRDSFTLNVRLDHAINAAHALRLSVDRSSTDSRNLGIGGYDLFDRAYENQLSNTQLRLSENGPLGRRMFTESRLQLRWNTSRSQSAVEMPAIRVNDAFTSGGAQQRGGQDSFSFEAATDLDCVRGAHSWRTGALVEGGRLRSDDMTNYLGTYTFANLADYQSDRASNYSRRIGDPDVQYSTFQAALYLQDDYRVSRSLLVSGGVRYGVQNHMGDRWNFSPRVTAAWSPRRNGSLTIRGGYGYFYDWIAGDLYKQTLLFDGMRQHELNIVSPSFPDPGSDGMTPPTNRYLWSDELNLPTAHRMNVGFDQTLTKNSRFTATYSRGWGRNLLRGRNLNTPVLGVRPDETFANSVALATDAASRSQSLTAMFSLVKLDWKNTFVMLNYTWRKNDTNTNGAFAIPANRDNLGSEWGPAAGDTRHGVGASFNTSPFKNVSVGINVRSQSGQPYNITTGRDDNADGLFNDRPAGVTRNSARGATQVDLSGRLSYAWGFGKPRQAGGPGATTIAIGDGGGMMSGFVGGVADKRYRLEFYISGQNLLNRVNYTAYSFVMTSPFFGQPVAASQPRKLQVGMRFGF